MLYLTQAQQKLMLHRLSQPWRVASEYAELHWGDHIEKNELQMRAYVKAQETAMGVIKKLAIQIKRTGWIDITGLKGCDLEIAKRVLAICVENSTWHIADVKSTRRLVSARVTCLNNMASKLTDYLGFRVRSPVNRN